MQNIYFQGRLYPVLTTPIPTATPVPVWTPPPAGVEVMASSGPSDDYPGRFDGDLIVYEADRGEGNADIYLYNISSGKTTAVATGPAIQRSPAIYGDKVVYSSYEVRQFNQSDADIYIYDVTSGATKRLALPGDQLNPRIYGDLLAWQDESPGRSSVNVVLYDRGTLARLKVPARTWAYSPDLSGGKVIWVDDPVAPAVYLYDLSGKMVSRVTNKTGIKGTPALDGDRITWVDTRSDFAQVYVLDLNTGVETQVTSDDTNHFTPAISGDRVVWVDFRNGNRDIYLYDLAARQELAVTTSEGQQVDPQIAGCTVAWADERNGSYDVYYKKIAGCTPSAAPAPVSLQPEVTSAPNPGTTSPTPAPQPSTPPGTPVSTPGTALPTTKSPGFEAVPALGSLAALVLLGRQNRFP
jgi:beta propeller repeat protein